MKTGLRLTLVVDKAVHRTTNSSKRHQETLDSDRCYGIDLNVPIEEYLPWSLSSMPIRKGRKVPRIIGRILLTLTVFAVTGFVLLVLIGLWDRYEKEATALGFSGPYERYLASQAGFLNDPKAYHAAMFERAPQGVVGPETTASIEE